MKEIRRENLRKLLASPRFDGDRAQFCLDAGITKGRLAQLLDESQPFGDAAARNLVEKLNLEADYFSKQAKNHVLVAEAGHYDLRELAKEEKFSPLAQLLARLFDAIPESDDMARSTAFGAASLEIRRVLLERLSQSKTEKP